MALCDSTVTSEENAKNEIYPTCAGNVAMILTYIYHILR